MEGGEGALSVVKKCVSGKAPNSGFSQEKLFYDQVKKTGRFYLENFQITTYIPTKETDLLFQK